jgi:NAD(P)-dependent dehydrogenase (short-subunit alcohol dehydrogenase family)
MFESPANKKVALVTGASRGIGLVFCNNLVEQGFEVVATSRSKIEDLENDKISFQEMDVTIEGQIAKTAKFVEEKYGKLDLLINNAGTIPAFIIDKPDDRKKFNSITDFDSDLILQMFKINSISPLIVIKHFLPLLQKSEGAKIIQISSISGSIGLTTQGGAYAYSASKTALNMFTKVLASDLRALNIITAALHPGSVQTRMGRSTADLTAEKSVEKMLNVIQNLTPKDSGNFLDLDGNKIPW